MSLKIGSTGEDVKKLQTRLGLTPSGTFGSETDLKVKEWQANNNLDPDGKVGELTWGKLFPGVTPEEIFVIPPSIFNLENLRGRVPEPVIVRIPEIADKFNITSVLRLTHFLAQCSHESSGFKRVYENLNYSAEGLKSTFPDYFPDDLSESYARNPIAIGNHVYANRMGNGDEASGDGYKFRGRGFVQLTGKSNYTEFSVFIGEDTVTNPDLVATKYPLASAAFFFNKKKLWELCDQGATEDVVTRVTKGVNGGTKGLAERLQHFNEYYPLLA
jgi:putative chitinase